MCFSIGWIGEQEAAEAATQDLGYLGEEIEEGEIIPIPISVPEPVESPEHEPVLVPA